MRKLSAHFVIDPGREPMRNGILEIDDSGTILNIRPNLSSREEDHLEFYSGILIPGLTNVHAHLELSHLHHQVEKGTGISGFIDQIVSKRGLESAGETAIRNLLFKMFQSGTQALGDIANNASSLAPKLTSPVITHTFVELFGLDPKSSESIWNQGFSLLNHIRQAGLSASLTPHAPYSLSRELWSHFSAYQPERKIPLSIHNLESREETELIRHRKGPLWDRFISMGFSEDQFPGPANSSLSWYLRFLGEKVKLLLVHNTFLEEEDWIHLDQRISQNQVYFGLCPRSNLFIENHLPTEVLNRRHQLKICLGTDSLASNDDLSLWEEVKTLASYFPTISLAEFVEMATIHGAEALGLEEQIGDFKIGKKPGILLLEGLDLKTFGGIEKSRVKRLV